MLVYTLLTVIQFYTWLIIAYVLMSWFPISGVFQDLYNVLASIVEPYLGIFRRIIPPMGAFDISPIVSILVLNLVAELISRLL
jgi:uncharacterized protein YggT (Ycf19 family)